MESGEAPKHCPLTAGLKDWKNWNWMRPGSPDFATGPFTGEMVDISPCTSTDIQSCQITRRLSFWNALLSQAQLQLFELPGTPTKLGIGFVHCPHTLDHDNKKLHQVAEFMRLLLKTHRCVTAIEIPLGRLNFYGALLCSALRNNDCIETLKIHDFIIDRLGPQYRFCSTILSSMTLKYAPCITEAPCPEQLLDALLVMLQTRRTLTSLHISLLLTNPHQAKMLLAALAENTSLKDLSINIQVIQEAPVECVGAFAEYLVDRTAITELSFVGRGSLGGVSMKIILRALAANKTIHSLSFYEAAVDRESMALLASILERNTTLRSFHIFPPVSQYTFVRHACYDIWLPALAINDTLHEVTVPLFILGPQHWAFFFDLLSEKRNMKRVTIEGDNTHGFDFENVCKVLQKSGAANKVTFSPGLGSRCYRDNHALLKCRGFTHVVASSDPESGTTPLWTLVRQLFSLSHVTSLTLNIRPCAANENLSSTLADYIKTTTVLRNLHVNTGFAAVPGDESNICWTIIIESLAKNQSITKLTIQTSCMEQQEIEKLADTIRCSKSIRRISVWDHTQPPSCAFAKRFSTNIMDNYNLVSADFPGYMDRDSFSIWDTARRNSSFVARASQFHHGGVLDRMTAGALERISRHRALLAEFSDMESITENEAAAVVGAGLRIFEDIHSFMRLAGVVREKVMCCTREPDCRQLDQLNEHCWRALRQYLMLDDVKEMAPEYRP